MVSGGFTFNQEQQASLPVDQHDISSRKVILHRSFKIWMFLVTLLALHAGTASMQALNSRIGDVSLQTSAKRLDITGTPRALYNVGSRPYSGDAETAARTFLQEHARTLRLDPSPQQLHTMRVNLVLGGAHIRFTQQYAGIPVYRGDVVVSMNDRNEIGMVINNWRSDISLPSVQPSFGTTEAIQRARNVMQVKGMTIGKEDEADLMVYENDQAGWQLVYRVTITNDDPYGDWEIFLDAMTGQLLHATDMFVRHTESAQGSGYVYLSDPLSAARRMYNTPGFTDGDDADTDSLTQYRTLVVLDSLTYEDGLYKLKGPFCNITEIEAPADPPFYAAPTLDGFNYTRSRQEFEAVMAYYHVSTAYQHLRSLGFEIPGLRSIRVDPHGHQGEDNSHYSPSGNWISFGEGGVDDAEDADVIWHEYAHAIQFNIVPTWGGGESGALGEGFGDYWAASYSRSLGQWDQGSYHYNWVFNWDGHNPLWAGRILNDSRTYPFGALPIHSAGQIWSAALMGIWNDLGRDITDRLVVKSLMYLGSGATGPDNAHAMIQADRDLYGGAHIPTLLYWLGTVKEFIDPNVYTSTISHQPLEPTLDTLGPYIILATVTPAQGSGNTEVQVHWGWNGEITETAAMQQISPTEFRAGIPGLGSPAICNYYLTASDGLGPAAFSPAGAPWQFYAFQAGVDSIAPSIIHTPTVMFPLNRWPALLRATVADNLGVDSVWIEVQLNGQSTPNVVMMSRLDGGDFTCEIPFERSQLHAGDSITYRILARDRSISRNTSVAPADGHFTLRLVDRGRTILLVNDDIAPGIVQEVQGKGTTIIHDSGEFTPSHQLFHRTLTQSGFLPVTTSFADFDVHRINNYDAIVLIGGMNVTPFADEAKRAALSQYAASGGRVLVEGGEVGYYYRARPDEVDATFRRSVLHDSIFVSDAISDDISIPTPSHPLVTAPYAIGTTLAMVDRSNYADRDAMTLMPDDPFTYYVAEWSAVSGTSGIIVHDSPDGARTIFLTFSVASIADSVQAGHFIENAIHYLLFADPASDSTRGKPVGQPEHFTLEQNYPNPFNPVTSIRFTLTQRASVTMKIFNVLGEEVITLLDGALNEGEHLVYWNGRTSSGELAGSGAYLYRLEARGSGSEAIFLKSKKMLLIR